MTTAGSSEELNVAPGSIVVVRDEGWLVTSAEQGSVGCLIEARGFTETAKDTTAAFYWDALVADKSHHRPDREGLRRRNQFFLRDRAITRPLSVPGEIPRHHRRRAVRLTWPTPLAIRTMFDSGSSLGPDRSPTPVHVEA